MSTFFAIHYNSKPVNPSLLADVHRSGNHWQADAEGSYHKKTLGMTCRLLYNTPEACYETQPLPLAHLNVVADIRLDNRQTLCEKLNLSNHHTLTDTALLAHAYLKWQEDCPTHLLGDFAFAIWDEKKQSLFCARDPIGVKPFFYFYSPYLFACASEIKALLCVPEIKRQLSEKNIARFLSTDSLMSGKYTDNTFYQNIYRLTPAHSLQATHRGLKKKTYWQLDPHAELTLKNDSDYIDNYRELLDKAVTARLRSHRNIGSELSGGIDSSTVTATAAKHRPELHTFTHTSTAGSKFLDETPHAKALCDHCHIVNRHFINADDYDLKKAIAHTVKCADGPILVSNPTLAFKVHEAVKQANVGVLLSGFGGDECATGHGNFYKRELAQQQQWRKLWQTLKQQTKIKNKRHYKAFLSAYLRQQYPALHKKLRRKTIPGTGLFALEHLPLNLAGLSKFDIPKQLQQPYGLYQYSSVREREYNELIGQSCWHLRARIESSNICSYGLGFEYRYPLLDIRLLEFCLSVPSRLKLKNGWGRFLVRHATEGLLPPSLQWRNEKAGSPVPAAYDYVKEKGHLTDVVNSTSLHPQLKPFISDINCKLFTDKDDYIALFNTRIAINILMLNELLQNHITECG